MKEKIFAIVAGSVKELNKELGYASLRNVSDETPLYGGDDSLDSLTLVTLISMVEAEVNDAFDSSVLLASEKAMSMRNSPYRNVGALVGFIEQELQAS
jgi:acyl carrier protein